MTFLAVLISLLVFVAVVQLRWVHRRHRILTGSGAAVLSRLNPIDLEKILAIIESYQQPEEFGRRYKSQAMWEKVGGIEGIRRLKENAATMLELVLLAERSDILAERWHREEWSPVSEIIRGEAIRLNKAARRLQLEHYFRIPFINAPLQFQEMVTSYYLIHCRLLGFYKIWDEGLVVHLEAVL